MKQRSSGWQSVVSAVLAVAFVIVIATSPGAQAQVAVGRVAGAASGVAHHGGGGGPSDAVFFWLCLPLLIPLMLLPTPHAEERATAVEVPAGGGGPRHMHREGVMGERPAGAAVGVSN